MRGGLTAQRISLFCVGAALLFSGAVVVFLTFTLATLMMNPALQGAEYWAAVRGRLQHDPLLVCLLPAGTLGVLVGLVLMVRAIFGRLRGAIAGAPPDATI